MCISVILQSNTLGDQLGYRLWNTKGCDHQKDAIPALQILAPTIFLSGILGVFRGYFQAYRNMMPTSISQIIEQVFNAAVSLLAAWDSSMHSQMEQRTALQNGGQQVPQ